MSNQPSLGHVLYVDDEKVLVNVVSLQLRHAGFQVSTASNGREALAKLGTPECQPDLILLDGMMPVMNGYDFLNAIERRGERTKTPVIFITAHDKPMSRDLAYAGGVVDYLSKPIPVKDLIYKVKNQVELAKARQRTELELRERIGGLEEANQVLADMMRLVLRMRAMTDLHRIADMASAGFRDLCRVEARFWRPWPGSARMMGAEAPAPKGEEWRARSQAVVLALKAGEDRRDGDGAWILVADGFAMEWLDPPPADSPKVESVRLFFQAVADVFRSFQDSVLKQKVLADLQEIIMIRNQLIRDLELVRSESNTANDTLGQALEEAAALAGAPVLDAAGRARLAQVVDGALLRTQYGDLANQRVFKILNTLTQIFHSLELNLDLDTIRELEAELPQIENKGRPIAATQASGDQTDVDALLAELGL